jgi:hypothetical protein
LDFAASEAFEVIDCNYDIRFSSIENFMFENVHIQLVIEGDGVMIGDKDKIAGEGTYTASVLVGYEIAEEGLSCTIISPSTGTGAFVVSGSRSGSDLNISIQFTAVKMSIGSFQCVDAEGKEANVPDIFSGEVTPQGYLPFTNVTVTPGVVLQFDVGKTGVGILTVIPRKMP